MTVQNISYTSFFYFFLALIPVFYIMYILKINLIKRTGISILRMTGQLILVGVYLQYIFKFNNDLVNMLYVFIMISLAVWTIAEDINFKEIKLYFLIFISVAFPLVLNLIIFNVLVLKLDNSLDAMYLIPLTGMILGNSMNGAILTLEDFIKTFQKNKDEYLFALALGADQKEALRPYVSSSISLSLKPSIASMANMGVVSLPGMMTGQILGGTIPLLAIKYQIAIMIAIFLGRFFSAYILIKLLTVFYFNKFSLIDRRFIES